MAFIPMPGNAGHFHPRKQRLLCDFITFAAAWPREMILSNIHSMGVI
jgi:hypothetical protein